MDPDGLEDALDLSKDRSQTQGVYIYQPAKAGKASGERPSKRRKVSMNKDSTEKLDGPGFVPLLNGDESAQCVQLRYNTYKQLSSEQEHKIQSILEDVDAGVLTDVLSFVRETSPQTSNGCIPTALVTVGSNVSSLSRLLSRLNDQLKSTNEGGVIVLESGDAPNLKTSLKNIIRAAVTNTEGNDGYQRFLTDRSGPRVLGYDLDLLHDYVQRRGTRKLVLALRDSEAFDPGLLTDLFHSSRKDPSKPAPAKVITKTCLDPGLIGYRSPYCLAFPRRWSYLKVDYPDHGKHFEVQEAGNCVDRIYEALQTSSDGRLWVGRNITSTLFEKATDYFQTPEAFSRMVKVMDPLYTPVCHISLPILWRYFWEIQINLYYHKVNSVKPSEICRLSECPFCEDLVETGSTNEARSMIEDDEYLLRAASDHVDAGQQAMRHVFRAVLLIHTCLQHTHVTKKTTISDLSVRALSGELIDSPLVEDMLATVRTLDSEKLGEVLDTLPKSLSDGSPLPGIQADLKALLEANPDSLPLRSEYNINSSVMKTTVIQQRVLLTKGTANLPEQDIQYTEIIDRLVGALHEFFIESLVRPQELFMNEAFVFDLRNPLKETFTPRPRFAIERALASPFDYLISTTAATAGAKISTKQPAAAILYQLYLESGALVNVHDLWQAFYGVYESDQGKKVDDRVVMSLFYSALSDMKMFGMVKTSRKKTDHLAKSAWMGL
ncbi:hypothetical protein N7451_011240 [Penicillium sp. IBT 35674x]|nr:hypothetical protein N7451_011240 [Penicillium sp. IBT 35674x]